MSRDQQGVVLFLSLLLALLFLLPAPAPPPAAGPAAGALLSFEGPEANDEVWVEVEGPVRSRGIYSLRRGKTAGEAVEKAGGIGGGFSLAREAGALRIEKSGILKVEEKKGGAALLSLAPPKMKVLSIPVNINSAGVEELDILPGVGPKTAQAIVEFREANGKFSSLEDLARVKGLGPKKFAAIRPHITLEE